MNVKVFGSITELTPQGYREDDNSRKINSWNEQVIANLPLNPSYPPVARGMFSITKIEHEPFKTNYAYGGRLIHFGANFKYHDDILSEWKNKFEELLSLLIWSEVTVIYIPEFISGSMILSWTLPPIKWDLIDMDDLKMLDRSYWNFKSKEL